jgi:uncharacterized membrane protein
MATLVALKFDTPDGADKALALAADLQRQELLQVQDAASVSWPVGRKNPKTKQAHNLAGPLALGGAFWGLLFGLLFFVPFFGMAVGAAMGALAGAMSDYGISDDFIKSVRDKVTPGTSAAFLLTSNATEDKVLNAFKTLPKFEIISTNLSKEQEDKLRETFGE